MTLTDWQMSYAGLLIDGATYRIIPPLEGLGDLPDLSTSDQARLRAHGLTPGDDFLDSRVVTVHMMVVADTGAFETAMGAVMEAFQPTVLAADLGDLTFRFPGIAGGGIRRIVGRVRKRSAPVELTWDDALQVRSALVDIQFYCADPHIYDDVESTVSTDLAAATTGHSWPQVWPMDWGGASTSGIVTATNAGTFATPWVATITGPVTNPSVENVDTGQALNFSANGGLSLAVGETLVIDSATRTALLGGTASRYDRLASPVSWWDLPPGATQLRFGGSTSGTPTMAVTWRSAWI